MMEIYALVVCWYTTEDPRMDRCQFIQRYATAGGCLRQAAAHEDSVMHGAYTITKKFGCVKKEIATWTPVR